MGLGVMGYNKNSKKPRKAYELKYRYGLEWDAYLQLVASSDGKCMLCGDPFVVFKAGSTSKTGRNRTSMHIDHDHITGKIRGLLCGPCNTGLGHFQDNPERLYAAATWIEAHRKVEG